MKTVLSIATLCGLCAAADADCRARVVYQQQYVAPAVYATPVIQYQPQAYYVASYSGFTASSEAVFGKRLDDLGQKLDVFTQRLEQALQQGNNDPKQAQGTHPGAAYMGRSCVKCHDSGTAKQKGGGHVFFDLGQFVATNEQQWKIQKRVRLGEMPPAPEQKATPTELTSLIEFIEEVGIQKASAQKQMPKEK